MAASGWADLHEELCGLTPVTRGFCGELGICSVFHRCRGEPFLGFPRERSPFVILLLLVPHSVSIIGDFLLLRYPFRERVIHADQIRSIEYAHAPPRHVQIRMKEGQIIPLQFFSLGTDMLFGFLWSWHTSKTRPKLGPSSRALVAFRVPPRLLEPPKLNP